MTHVPTQYEVETFTGQYVDTQNPQAHTIRLEDIAHALANTCRYGGHCQPFYSVAEHAVFCSIRVERQGYGKWRQLAALHHDDAEAYLGDIPRPMKPLLGDAYKELTERMDQAIMEALLFQHLPGPGADAFHDPAVKEADSWALLVEARHLLPSKGINWEGSKADWGLDDFPSRIVVPDYWWGGLTPANAEALYLQRHKELIAS